MLASRSHHTSSFCNLYVLGMYGFQPYFSPHSRYLPMSCVHYFAQQQAFVAHPNYPMVMEFNYFLSEYSCTIIREQYEDRRMIGSTSSLGFWQV